MAFSAVVTTGIYCRPGCPARPNPGNVRRYEVAAAAEAAGFRACLKCRPYRMSDPVGVVGPDLVCRAVRLVIDGALDDGNEGDLAARLGVSARHLRRLFVNHVGVTPDQLARSRRAHFARRLLDDTDLSVAAIAFASGFGSVRQLNRACSDIFRAAPSELRARRRVTDRLVADGGLTLRLPVAGPLDWESAAGYFQARAIAGVESVTAGTYRRVVMVDGDPAMLEVWRNGDEHLLLRAHLPHWEGLIHVVERVRRVFGLDQDVAGAEAVLVRDPMLAPYVAKRSGLRVPGTWDPFETGVRAILGQQISVRGAGAIAARLVERHGTPVPGLAALGLTHAFPDAHTLAGADLRDLGLTRARADGVRAFAAAVADGRIRLDASVPREELVGSIGAVRGLGEWTANYLALRMGEPDAFPATDLGLRKAAARSGQAALSSRELERRAEAWRPWRAFAAVHLWLA